MRFSPSPAHQIKQDNSKNSKNQAKSTQVQMRFSPNPMHQIMQNQATQ
jgi:hypothetical protein